MVLALAVGAHASVITSGDVLKVDFGAVAPTAEGYVQYTYNAGSVVLMDGGTEDDVTITVTGADGDFINNLQGSGSSDSTVYADHIAGNGADDDTLTITISGLDDELTYDLFAGMRRSVSDTAWNHTYTVGGTDYAYARSGSFIDSYHTYSGLSSSGGVLSFTITDTTNAAIASISELTLTAIPEPATIGMLGLGTVGLLAFRRRMS